MEPDRNLLILHSPGKQDSADWREVADLVRRDAPDIDVRIWGVEANDPIIDAWQMKRPGLVFAAAYLNGYVPKRGKVYHGRPMTKDVQLRRLGEAGIRVPRSIPLIPGLLLRKEVWGDYVVVKPARGGHGVGVALARTEDIATKYGRIVNDGSRHGRVIVQEFIDHTDAEGRLVDWRALMMFGSPLYLHRRRGKKRQRALDVLAAELSGEIASNRPGSTRERELVHDEEVLAFAKRACAAFPEVPVLGVDIIRRRESGELYALEVNPSGTVWHFSSSVGVRQIDAATRKASYRQFNALETAAALLVEKTRAEAV